MSSKPDILTLAEQVNASMAAWVNSPAVRQFLAEAAKLGSMYGLIEEPKKKRKRRKKSNRK